MTIALPDRSVRHRHAYVFGYLSDRSLYEPDLPYAGVWDSVDLKRHLTTVSAAKPMSVAEIEALVAQARPVDVTPSDNDTTYIEWETGEGFASLEVGYTRFAFSFLPHSGSDQKRYGRTGNLTDRPGITSLIHQHS